MLVTRKFDKVVETVMTGIYGTGVIVLSHDISSDSSLLMAPSLYRVLRTFTHTSPHRLAHTAEIRTAVGGVLLRSCSGADLRLPGIPRRIRGGSI